MARVKMYQPTKYSEDGRLMALFCKLCGAEIAAAQNGRFLRNNLYAEASILLKGNARHVTHGCSRCLTLTLEPKVLRAMYLKDLKDLGDSVYQPNRSRVPICVGVISTDGCGIV